MYSPAAFSVSESSLVREFIESHSFGILVSTDGGLLHDTHTPLLISENMQRLEGHIARANPQWRSWKENPKVKAIFHGPHSYISPRYYVSEFNVPTWNYSAVSIDGQIQTIDEPLDSLRVIQTLIGKYEGPTGWKLDLNDPRYMKLLDAVVCFSIEIDRIDAKFKLNQNKSIEDKQSVISHLRANSSHMDQQTAELMAKAIP